MLSRIRNMWALAKKDPQKLDKLLDAPEEVLSQVPDETKDVQGVFFSEGTERDFEEFQNQQSGMSKWIKRIKDLV